MIGVFDSGLGGLSVVKAIQRRYPQADIYFYGDSAHNPYGTKTTDEVLARCQWIGDHLLEADCQAIVIACNTATSVCVEHLRERYSIPIIGMEPAVKLAYDQGYRQIAVWATELTLKQPKLNRLLARYTDLAVHKVACGKLVELVEEEAFDQAEQWLANYIKESGQVQAIILGCTHFVFFKKQLTSMYPHLAILDGNEGTVHHLAELANLEGTGKMILENSDVTKIDLMKRLLERVR